MSGERSEEDREPGQHPLIHEQAGDEPRVEDDNELADDRVQVLQPDGDEAPDAQNAEE